MKKKTTFTRVNERPFAFKIYNFACGATLGLLALMALVGVWLSVRRERQITPQPVAIPESIRTIFTADPLPSGPLDADAATAPQIPEVPGLEGGRRAWRFRIDATHAPLPPPITDLAHRRYREFGEAIRAAGHQAREVLVVPSADLVAAKADAVEEGIVVGIEMAFVDGKPGANVPPLADVLSDLASTIAKLAVKPGTDWPITPAESAAAHAYLGLSQSYLTHPDERADSVRLAADWPLAVRELRIAFETHMGAASEPRGLWDATPRLRAAYRAMRALMTPAEVPAARAVMAGLLQAPELAAHYRRWLQTLDLLHGQTARSAATVAHHLATQTPPDSPVSFLPWREHLPADLLVLGARLAIADKGQTVEATHPATPLGILETLAIRAASGTLGNLPATPGWLDYRLWARAAALPMNRHTASTGPEAAIARKLAMGTGYKWICLGMRHADLPADWHTRIEPLGLSCEPSPMPVDAPPWPVDPLPTLYARLGESFATLPDLLAPVLTERDLRDIGFVWRAPNELPISVADRSREMAELCHGLALVACAALGVPPAPSGGGAPRATASESAVATAMRWLRDDLPIDPDLAHPRRDVFPIDIRADGATIWLGTSGIVFQPMELTVSPSPTQPDRAHLILMPITDRHLFATHAPPPSRQRWQLLAEFAPDPLIPTLFAR